MNEYFRNQKKIHNCIGRNVFWYFMRHSIEWTQRSSKWWLISFPNYRINASSKPISLPYTQMEIIQKKSAQKSENQAKVIIFQCILL